jgi:hypothetical protein
MQRRGFSDGRFVDAPYCAPLSTNCCLVLGSLGKWLSARSHFLDTRLTGAFIWATSVSIVAPTRCICTRPPLLGPLPPLLRLTAGQHAVFRVQCANALRVHFCWRIHRVDRFLCWSPSARHVGLVHRATPRRICGTKPTPPVARLTAVSPGSNRRRSAAASTWLFERITAIEPTVYRFSNKFRSSWTGKKPTRPLLRLGSNRPLPRDDVGENNVGTGAWAGRKVPIESPTREGARCAQSPGRAASR